MTNIRLSEHIQSVISFLNDNAEYAFLRNYEALPNDNASRDCDIIISRKSYNKIKKRLIRLIVASGWQIINYLHSDRLITLVCACIDDSDVSIMQWDFFFNTSVHGVLLMDADEFLSRRRFNGVLYHVDKECEFLDKYLYLRAVGAKYPERYANVKEIVQDAPFVAQKINDLFGCANTCQCDRASKRTLKQLALGWNVRRSPVALLRNIARFCYTFTRNYLSSATGFSIGFSGADGVGKTTVIYAVIENLGKVFAKAHCYYHFRPTLFGNMSNVAHRAGLKKDVDNNYDAPHRGSKTGRLSSLIRLCYYSIDYIVGYWIKVKTKTRITRLVIFDRYFTDIICDSERSRIYLNHRFLYFWKKLFIPSLDYNILLCASRDKIVSRKNELTLDEIEEINTKIDYLSAKHGFYKVCNNSTPQHAAIEILKIVFDGQNTKNIKRLHV